uniref:Putative secreted protein n=1 Tax=Anopheles triannulatus TaxID=58253 RepID=A0A2M4B6V6_9DIPT
MTKAPGAPLLPVAAGCFVSFQWSGRGGGNMVPFTVPTFTPRRGGCWYPPYHDGCGPSRNFCPFPPYLLAFGSHRGR